MSSTWPLAIHEDTQVVTDDRRFHKRIEMFAMPARALGR
jgi:hypothetical protein